MPSKVLKLLRTSPFERTVLALLVLAFALLAAVAIASVLTLRQTRDLDAQVVLTQRVRELAQNVLTDTVDAETGERGYVLTGEKPYLAVTREAQARLSNEMRTLRELSKPHLEQLRRIDTLRIHVDAKVAEIQRAVAYVDAHRQSEAVDVVKGGQGLQEMVRIRQLIAAFNAEEAQRLAKRIASADRAAEEALAINLTSAVLVVIVGLASILLVRRYIDALRRSRAELDEVNQGLERTVEERTGELVAARDRAEALLREVNHRVGNSLQLVSSFISMQSRGLDNEDAKQALRETQARIGAVAQVHRRLYTSQEVETVELGDYLAGLIEELQGSMAAEGISPTISVKTAPLKASTDRAVALGVIVAELITNAVKYAYAEGAPGEIRVELALDGKHTAVLSVEDDGAGMKGAKPKGTGLGRKIIDAMASNLKSKIEYDSKRKGVRASMKFEC